MPKTFTPQNQPDTTHLRKALLAGPGEQSLKNIFAYARALNVVKTKTTGTVNLLMN